jgi:tetratricopeptide (TPR) repeat protein
VARIYVSSTYADLAQHREQVYRALRELGHDVLAMEDYVAADQRPLAKCLADVASCDLYVGIFAHRYGHVPGQDNPEGRSITELEYRHAEAHGIPRLVFLLDLAVPWLPSWMDTFTGDGEQGARIRALREELGRERLASFFTTAEELARKVGAAVTRQLAELAARQETYQLVKGLPTVPAKVAWTIPPPVRSFTGRTEQLASLHNQLTDQGAAALVPTAALTGMGGVGKTQLALAYAQRYRAEYELGWWVPAETELGLLTALADLGMALGLPADLPPGELAARTRDALGQRSKWLLVFDNAPDPAAVAEFLPGTGGGHVLVTSRDSAWHGIAEPVPVDLLPLDEAVQLLVRRSGDPDKRAASTLAEALGRLPLALEQAASYAATARLPLARYLALFDQRRAELLGLGKPLAYQGTVDATFTLALDRLQERSPAAGQLVELCALLAPDELPLPLLLSRPELLSEPLASVAADELRRGAVVGALYLQGLLTRDAGETARMHRLVQAVTVAHLANAERQQRTAGAVGLLDGLFPSEGEQPEHWSVCAQLLPHVQALLNHARVTQLSSPAVANLLTSTGRYLWARGLDIRLAVDVFEQALAIDQRLHEGDHSDVSRSLSNLNIALRAVGEYERAQELAEQALAIDQRLHEGDHPHLATSLSNLAETLRTLGEYERARELDEQALAMRQRLYQGDYLGVAASLENLANDLLMLGEHRRAQELREQALAMWRRLYQGDNPYVARSLSNLALNLRRVGEYERARELDEQALAMQRRLYQGDHREVAGSLSRLAVDLAALGEYGRARELDEQALAMRQRLYQGDHPDVANSLSNLAADLRQAGEEERARELDEQALAMRQRLGEL